MSGPAPAWAVFDAAWYRARYPEAVAALADTSDKALLAYYLETGQRLAHSPNPWFDEAWYRRVHPAVARLLEDGAFASGMDHYCRQGHCLDRRPHWLFDERAYRGRYPDLSDQVLRDRKLANGYDHYLRNGNREGRIGHPLFDPARFLAGFDAETAEAHRKIGPYRVYLTSIRATTPEPRTSALFDPDWYRARYPEAVAAIEAGDHGSALAHYLCNDTPSRFDPLPQFSEAWYQSRNDDVAAAVAARQTRNGYVHFLGSGVRERRSPSPDIDLRWYAEQQEVAAELDRRKALDPFTHLLTIGLPAGLPTAPPPAPEPSHHELLPTAPLDTLLLPALGRIGVDFTCASPALSVAITPRNQFPALLVQLAALRDAWSGEIDLILVDRGSSDPVRTITRHVHGAQLLRFETAIEERVARHAALQCARADMILFLAPGVRPAHGAIARGLERLRRDASVAAVCGLGVTGSGMISDAGGIIWDDGTMEYHAAGASPLAPEANVVRDADFAPPSFLLGRVDALRAVEAFADPDASLEQAAAAMGLRLRARRQRIVYDPGIVALVGAPAELVNTESSQAALRDLGGPLLSAPRASPALSSDEIIPRPVRPGAHRILYIDDSVPLRVTGSGFVRSNDVIRAMAGMGYAVTIFPVLGCRQDLASVYADMPDTVEILHDRSLARLENLLTARQGWFDTIWVSRIHNLDMVAPILASTAAKANARLVLDTEAISAERRQQKLAMIGQAMDLPAAIAEELSNAHLCDHIMAVSVRDAATLASAGFAAVSVLGHIRVPTPTPRGFADRHGMLFVGAIHEEESPNFDSLCWFVDAVLPLIDRELGWETRLTIAGYTAPGVSLARFEDHPRITLRGTVPDLTSAYDSHRLFVAPTRFAAGMPYKVQEAASFGLPVVASSLLAEQLDWHDGMELASAPTGDARTMADRIVALYRDPILWQRLREGALRRLAVENTPETYRTPLLAALGPPGRPYFT